MSQLFVLATVVLIITACGSDDTGVSGAATDPSPSEPMPDRGATAVWNIDNAEPPTTTAGSFVALVTRLECSGGETGEVLEPVITTDDEQIVVTFTVEPLPPGDYTCPGNNEVPHVVLLDRPIGARDLVDGACVSGEAVSTIFCADGPVRWSSSR